MHQYDPKQVKMTFNKALITGYADGSFIHVEFHEDLFKLRVGSDGEATRSKSNNRSARITLTLMPGSESNLIMSGFYNADVVAGIGGSKTAGLQIVDLSTGSGYYADRAWIVKGAGYDFQQEGQNKVWLIDTDELQEEHGFAA